ncbi:hypothetical protein KJ991_00320 [Patescibacteria group bacterium]|nr:hypothetical protein [Patescibacteria group bacterium]MBU4057423.1 hypothetical protein [Patescibacteria group bacterium]MBU4115696.1 hypothetical protein [Patescibacteria group bacterium]
MNKNVSVHLNKDKKIELGSFYTPEIIVDKIYEFIDSFLSKQNIKKSNIVYFDNACGCGAFYKENRNFILADIDKRAVDFMKNNFSIRNIVCTNSIKDVSRKKFNISSKSFLINVGNPPYNDITSEIKQGKKGIFDCDTDLFDRDLGITFIKSFNKLESDLVCIIHPLSYLIKQTNFNRFKNFKDNYKLVKGEIFSSELFNGTGKTKFPIVMALYQRGQGMDYDYIRNFDFSIFNNNKSFILKNFLTTDGFIDKYPSKILKKNPSSLDLYYYTFRDINSLKRNRDFVLEPNYNSISISLENLYKYSYLYTFKKLFNPQNLWIYGNLSPLLDKSLEDFKKDYIVFSIVDSGLGKKLSVEQKQLIKKHYGISYKDYNEPSFLNDLKIKLSQNISNLVII